MHLKLPKPLYWQSIWEWEKKFAQWECLESILLCFCWEKTGLHKYLRCDFCELNQSLYKLVCLQRALVLLLRTGVLVSVVSILYLPLLPQKSRQLSEQSGACLCGNELLICYRGSSISEKWIFSGLKIFFQFKPCLSIINNKDSFKSCANMCQTIPWVSQEENFPKSFLARLVFLRCFSVFIQVSAEHCVYVEQVRWNQEYSSLVLYELSEVKGHQAPLC